MKKLSEIKTGEKFEYEGKYYTGMVIDESDDSIPKVFAINLETGYFAGPEFALNLDTLVRPVELHISEATVDIVRCKPGDTVALNSPYPMSRMMMEKMKARVKMSLPEGVKVMVLDAGMKVSCVITDEMPLEDGNGSEDRYPGRICQ